MAAPTRLGAAITFLNERCPIIRIGLEEAVGFGHQSASIHVACRLRALGYRGVLEIVASERVQETKLAGLLPSLTSISAPGSVQVITPEQAKEKFCELGMFGGLGAWYHGKVMLNVRHCLILQPLQWGSKRVLLGPTDVKMLDYTKYAAFRYDAVSTPPIATIIKQTMGTDPCTSVLQDLVRRVQNGRLDLMMVYGLHNVPRSSVPIEALQGALQARGQGRTVMVVIDSYRTPPGALPLTDPMPIAKALASTSPVVTLSCKGLPEPLFRALYSVSTLPPVLEGANTTNFMRILGRPYMSVSTHATPFPEVRRYRDVVKECHAMTRMLGGGAAVDTAAMARFINACQRRGSPQARYFAHLQEQVRAPNADQVAQGLQLVHQRLRSLPALP